MPNSDSNPRPPAGMILATYAMAIMLAAILGLAVLLCLLGINALIGSPWSLGWSIYLPCWLGFMTWIFYPNQKSWVFHLRDSDGNVFEVLGRKPD